MKTPAPNHDLWLEALAAMQVTAERHRQAIDELHKFTHRPPAQADRKLLTATDPIEEIDLGTDGVASIALLNFSTVTAYLGIAGRSAAQNNGVPVAPLSFVVLPLRTNVLDVGIDPTTAPVNGADIVILRYDTAQPFEAGPLSGGAGGGGGGQVSPLPGSTWDTSDRVGRLLGHVTVDNAIDVVDRAARLLGVADVSDRAARALGLVGPAAGATWDIADRAARLLGVADVSDRAGRLLGVADVSDRVGRALGLVGPAAGSVWDVSDRAARALGLVGPAAGATWDVSDRVARQLGVARRPEMWSITASPGSGVVATVTKAAVAGQHHVCTALIANAATNGGAAFGTSCTLRDGASGAGTPLAQFDVSGATATSPSQVLALSDLAIAGSTNTPMTLEFNAGSGYERVTLIGYTTA